MVTFIRNFFSHHSWTRPWLYFLTILFGFTTSCLQVAAPNAVTGTYDVLATKEQYEIAYGDRYFTQMKNENQPFHYSNSTIAKYVKKVGKKIAKVSDRPDLPYQFVVVENSTPNAWALPGGKIGIHTGFLSLLDNEAELAFVLAHETVHAVARHRAQNWERGIVRQCFTYIAMATAPLSYLLTHSQLEETLIAAKHTRDAELEADFYAVKYLIRAGYDPQAAEAVHDKLAALTSSSESSVEKLFSTHPSSEERALLARQQVQSGKN